MMSFIFHICSLKKQHCKEIAPLKTRACVIHELCVALAAKQIFPFSKLNTWLPLLEPCYKSCSHTCIQELFYVRCFGYKKWLYVTVHQSEQDPEVSFDKRSLWMTKGHPVPSQPPNSQHSNTYSLVIYMTFTLREVHVSSYTATLFSQKDITKCSLFNPDRLVVMSNFPDLPWVPSVLLS